MAVNYFAYFIIYSFLGWLYESVIYTVEERRFVNRGFLNGPVCPVYGFGAVLIIFILGGIKNVFVIFILGVLITSVLEYFTSWAMEKLFHARWWDYSSSRFQLHGRVSLESAVVFGLFSVAVVKWIQPLVNSLVLSVPRYVLSVAAGAVLAVFLTDFFVTLSRMRQIKIKLKEVQDAINSFRESSFEKARNFENAFTGAFENSSFYSERIRTMFARISPQEKRILGSFPRASSRDCSDALDKLKESCIRKNKK